MLDTQVIKNLSGLWNKKKAIEFSHYLKKKVQCSPQLITNPEKLDLSTVKHFAIKLQISTWSSKF